MSDGLAMVLLAKAAAFHRHGFTVSRWLGFGFYFDLLIPCSILDLWDGRTFSRCALYKALKIRTCSNIFLPPHTVQQVCIPTAILNVDVLCQAKSGLGKTAVFVLTTLHQLEPVPGECSILVMCHTRELAYQIKNEYARFSKYLPDVKTAVFYGGTPIQKDIEVLSNKDTYPNIIVGTPGRLNALVRDKKLSLRNVKAFVLDECDKMLDQTGEYFHVHSMLVWADILIFHGA